MGLKWILDIITNYFVHYYALTYRSFLNMQFSNKKAQNFQNMQNAYILPFNYDTYRTNCTSLKKALTILPKITYHLSSKMK